MRMGVFTGDAAVRCPAGMTDPAVGHDRIFLAHLAESGNFSDFFDKMDLLVLIKQGDPGAVITTVFELGKAV